MRKFWKVLPLVVICCIVFTSVFGLSSSQVNSNGVADPQFEMLAGNIWKSIVRVVQVAALIAIGVAGLRYMFASADQKADIKQSTIHLMVGIAFVFGATLVLEIIQKITQELL